MLAYLYFVWRDGRVGEGAVGGVGGGEEREAHLGDGNLITTSGKGQEDAGRLLQNREAFAQICSCIHVVK